MHSLILLLQLFFAWVLVGMVYPLWEVLMVSDQISILIFYQKNILMH